MREEFHGNGGEGGTWIHKLLYGWGTTNVNIWLPSLSELVGYNPDTYNDMRGCYQSAMQGLNLSSWYDTDSKGGSQWVYFIQFNASGGGEKIWDCIGKEPFWTRSPVYAYADRVTSFSNSGGVGYVFATASHAVRQCKFHIIRLSPKDRGKAHSLHCFSSSLQSRLCREPYIHLLPPFCGEGRIGSKLLLLRKEG